MKITRWLALSIITLSGAGAALAQIDRHAQEERMREEARQLRELWAYPGVKPDTQTGGFGGGVQQGVCFSTTGTYTTPDAPEKVWAHYWRLIGFPGEPIPWDKPYHLGRNGHYAILSPRPGVSLGQLCYGSRSETESVVISRAAGEPTTHVVVIVYRQDPPAGSVPGK